MDNLEFNLWLLFNMDFNTSVLYTTVYPETGLSDFLSSANHLDAFFLDVKKQHNSFHLIIERINNSMDTALFNTVSHRRINTG